MKQDRTILTHVIGTLEYYEMFLHLDGPPVFQIDHLILPDFTLSTMSIVLSSVLQKICCMKQLCKMLTATHMNNSDSVFVFVLQITSCSPVPSQQM